MQGLLQASGKAPRTARQVVNLLSRRIDCALVLAPASETSLIVADVHRNVESVEKQSRLVEQKLSDLFAVQESVDHEGKDTSNVEILEELDEEGHVVCECPDHFRVGLPRLEFSADPMISKYHCGYWQSCCSDLAKSKECGSNR